MVNYICGRKGKSVSFVCVTIACLSTFIVKCRIGSVSFSTSGFPLVAAVQRAALRAVPKLPLMWKIQRKRRAHSWDPETSMPERDRHTELCECVRARKPCVSAGVESLETTHFAHCSPSHSRDQAAHFTPKVAKTWKFGSRKKTSEGLELREREVWCVKIFFSKRRSWSVLPGWAPHGQRKAYVRGWGGFWLSWAICNDTTVGLKPKDRIVMTFFWAITRRVAQSAQRGSNRRNPAEKLSETLIFSHEQHQIRLTKSGESCSPLSWEIKRRMKSVFTYRGCVCWPHVPMRALICAVRVCVCAQRTHTDTRGRKRSATRQRVASIS